MSAEGASPVPVDPAAFRALEHERWTQTALGYDAYFRDLTAQAADASLAGAGVRSGARVLDIGSGPGGLASAAAALGAQVTGIDFAAPMVELARASHPAIDFVEGDAEDLPFRNESFDAVIMAFTLLHVSRPDRAIAEAHRVLRPGGGFAFSVWATPDQALGFDIVLSAVRDHGQPAVTLPSGPPFFTFCDPVASLTLLESCGFTEVEVRTVPLLWRLPSPAAVFEAFWTGSARTGALLRAQEPRALEEIRAAVVAAARGFATAGNVEIPMPAVITSAVRRA